MSELGVRMPDKFYEFLKERKEKIKRIEDEDIRKIVESIHDYYAENYINMKQTEGKFITNEQIEMLKSAYIISKQSGFPNKLADVLKEIMGRVV